jgi:hypothetical protein
MQPALTVQEWALNGSTCDVLKGATIATRQESESDLKLGATIMQHEVSSAVEIHSSLQVITLEVV